LRVANGTGGRLKAVLRTGAAALCGASHVWVEHGPRPGCSRRPARL